MSKLDLSLLLQQAKSLQDKLKEMQESAAVKTVEGNAGGGMVRVVVDGTMQVRRVALDPSLLESKDHEMLEDLIAAAVNDGLRRAQEMVAGEISKLGPLAGLKIPGLGGE